MLYIHVGVAPPNRTLAGHAWPAVQQPAAQQPGACAVPAAQIHCGSLVPPLVVIAWLTIYLPVTFLARMLAGHARPAAQHPGACAVPAAQQNAAASPHLPLLNSAFLQIAAYSNAYIILYIAIASLSCTTAGHARSATQQPGATSACILTYFFVCNGLHNNRCRTCSASCPTTCCYFCLYHLHTSLLRLYV